MSAVADVTAYLLAQGVAGGATDWGLIRRRLTDTPVPDRVVVVAEDGGSTPEVGAAAGIGDSAMKDVGVLVTVRAAQWFSDDSADKAQEILTLLHGLQDTTLGGSTRYLRIGAVTPEPVWVGFDEQGRPLHTIAFRLLSLV